MHNIPSLILLVVFVISWRNEIVGAITFILAGLLYIIFLLINPELEWYMLLWAVQISGPAFFIGVLFLMGWLKKRESRKNFKTDKNKIKKTTIKH